jgi:hypothetical protein
MLESNIHSNLPVSLVEVRKDKIKIKIKKAGSKL